MAVTVRFFRTGAGTEPALDYLRALEKQDRQVCGAMLRAVQEYGLEAPGVAARQLEGKLWGLKPDPHRLMYVMIAGPTMVVLHACKKEGQKTSKPDLEVARKRMKQVLARGEGKEEVTEADVATRKRNNKHIGRSLDDWLGEETAKDPSFAAGLNAQFDKYRLAQQLKTLREKAGLSQQQLAERVHTKQPSIARMENARTLPKLDLLQRVARALGTEMVVSFRRVQTARRTASGAVGRR